MAGHSCFETTRKFYLAVRKDLIERARAASTEAMKEIFIAKSLQEPFSSDNLESAPIASD